MQYCLKLSFQNVAGHMVICSLGYFYYPRWPQPQRLDEKWCFHVLCTSECSCFIRLSSLNLEEYISSRKKMIWHDILDPESKLCEEPGPVLLIFLYRSVRRQWQLFFRHSQFNKPQLYFSADVLTAARRNLLQHSSIPLAMFFLLLWASCASVE